MKILPIVPKGSIEGEYLLNCLDLPLFYMNDYSKVGLPVSSYEEALNILRRNHYMVSGFTGYLDSAKSFTSCPGLRSAAPGMTVIWNISS